jgi:3-oxoacyl-[acyl-carrier protein] reductase
MDGWFEIAKRFQTNHPSVQQGIGKGCFMDLELMDRVALVTGASRGIGLAVARRLAAEGCKVGMIARSSDDLRGAVKDLTAMGAQVIAVPADLMDAAAVQPAVERVAAALGPVEILVNNAGGSSQMGVTFEDLTDEDWQGALELNFLSVVRVTRAVLPGMRELGHGSIVMVSTDAAMQPEGFVPHYTAAKAALLNLSKSLSHQLGRIGIRVNAVSPGMTLTTNLSIFLKQRGAEQGISMEEAGQKLVRDTQPNISAGRPAEADEIADAIAFLVSPRAAYINGVNLRIDSGRTLSML